jgi:hypothetical protein
VAVGERRGCGPTSAGRGGEQARGRPQPRAQWRANSGVAPSRARISRGRHAAAAATKPLLPPFPLRADLVGGPGPRPHHGDLARRLELAAAAGLTQRSKPPRGEIDLRRSVAEEQGGLELGTRRRSSGVTTSRAGSSSSISPHRSSSKPPMEQQGAPLPPLQQCLKSRRRGSDEGWPAPLLPPPHPWPGGTGPWASTARRPSSGHVGGPSLSPRPRPPHAVSCVSRRSPAVSPLPPFHKQRARGTAGGPAHYICFCLQLLEMRIFACVVHLLCRRQMEECL